MFFRVWLSIIAAAFAVLAAPISASAVVLTHSAADFPGTLTPAFGTLTDPVGTAFIGSGVDYSYGNVEGVFNDPPYAFCGINGGNQCDLVTGVDARIVLPGTTTQGLTDFVQVSAGSAAANTLTLTVFDLSHNPIGTALNTNGGVDTFAVDLSGLFNIAYFSVTGGDTFGVETVSIDQPGGAGAVSAVPLPAALPLYGAALAVLGLFGWRRRMTTAA